MRFELPSIYVFCVAVHFKNSFEQRNLYELKTIILYLNYVKRELH